jgi:hypothetical protein
LGAPQADERWLMQIFTVLSGLPNPYICYYLVSFMLKHKSLPDYMARNAGWALQFWIPGLLLVTGHLAYSSSQQASVDPQALVRQVVENELDARSKESIYWRYLSQVQEGAESRTDVLIETPKGTLKRMLAQGGRPLTPEQLQQEDARIRELIRNPRELDRETNIEKSDLLRIQRLFKLLPDALLYTLESSDGPIVRLSFRPNPGFNPPTFESKICRVIQGSMLVDAGQKRLVELRGVMSRDLEFGWGVIGKLYKGGSIELRQEQVDSGRWVVTFFDLNIIGRAWFFKTIGKQKKETRWSFQRVPGSLTLEDAAEMAKRAVWDARPERSTSSN